MAQHKHYEYNDRRWEWRPDTGITIQLVLSVKDAYFYQSHFQLGRIPCINPGSVDIVFVASLQLLFQQGKSQQMQYLQMESLMSVDEVSQTKCPQTSCRDTKFSAQIAHNSVHGHLSAGSHLKGFSLKYLIVLSQEMLTRVIGNSMNQNGEVTDSIFRTVHSHKV